MQVAPKAPAGPAPAVERDGEGEPFSVNPERTETANKTAAENGRVMDRSKLRLVGPMHLAETREEARAQVRMRAARSSADARGSCAPVASQNLIFRFLQNVRRRRHARHHPRHRAQIGCVGATVQMGQDRDAARRLRECSRVLDGGR